MRVSKNNMFMFTSRNNSNTLFKNPDTEFISWNGLLSLNNFQKRYKNTIINNPIFFSTLTFFNSQYEEINNINFVRVEGKSYFYKNSLDIHKFLGDIHIGVIVNSEYQRHGYFIRMMNNKWLCLHHTQWWFLLYGSISQDTFTTIQQFNLYQYEKDQVFQDLNGNKINVDPKYVSFLMNIKNSKRLLKKLV